MIDGERRAPSNREIAALLGVDERTVKRDKRKLRGTNVPSDIEESSRQAEVVEGEGTNVPPDSSARADRVTRDNRAEQKRAARDEREANVQARLVLSAR